MKNYIPVDLWKDTFNKPPVLVFVEKVPLSKIKIDKSLFSFQNEVDPQQVDFIANNFDIDFWMPIRVDPDYFLLDGQHRLQVARRLGLKYIDVVIDNEREKSRNA